MTLEKVRGLLSKQAAIAGDCTRNGVRLIREMDLERTLDFKPGTRLRGA